MQDAELKWVSLLVITSAKNYMSWQYARLGCTGHRMTSGVSAWINITYFCNKSIDFLGKYTSFQQQF